MKIHIGGVVGVGGNSSGPISPNTESENIVCPFCKETGFDLMGLKIHLERNHCDVYNEIKVDRHPIWG